MKKIFLYTIILATVFSCNDYLDVEPKGLVIPETIEHYDLLLIPLHTLSYANDLAYTADDFSPALDANTITNNITIKSQLFTFENRYSRPSDVSASYNESYKSIYVVNKVISDIDKAPLVYGYKEEDRAVIKARAKYKRAMYYFYLVNLYGKHYSQESMNSLSIPIVTEADLSQEAPGLSTISDVYDLITEDLNFAVKHLPKVVEDKLMLTKGSAYALLARSYLYQSDFEKGLKYSNLALEELNTLVTYNQDLMALGFYERLQAPWAEQYSAMYFDDPKGFSGEVYDNCNEIFEPNDSRRSFWIAENCNWSYDPTNGWTQECSGLGPSRFFYSNTLPSVGEMYLTAAECLARKGNNQALDYLNTLRTVRIPGAQPKVSGDFSSNTELVRFILEERRRETFLSGTRLFDIKRQNLESEFQKTVVHKKDIDGIVYEYKAEPNSGKLVLPIPANVKKFL